MNRLLLLIIAVFFSLNSNAQEACKEYSVYVIVSFEEHMDNTGFTFNIDDGKNVSMVKDENGKKLRLRTPASALTYFESLGWKLCSIEVSKKDNDDFTYWIFKKPVSKEEYEDMINNAIIGKS